MEFTHLSKSVIQILCVAIERKPIGAVFLLCYQQVILLLVYKVKFETFSLLILSNEQPLQ